MKQLFASVVLLAFLCGCGEAIIADQDASNSGSINSSAGSAVSTSSQAASSAPATGTLIVKNGFPEIYADMDFCNLRDVYWIDGSGITHYFIKGVFEGFPALQVGRADTNTVVAGSGEIHFKSFSIAQGFATDQVVTVNAGQTVEFTLGMDTIVHVE